jgi:predicted porin
MKRAALAWLFLVGGHAAAEEDVLRARIGGVDLAANGAVSGQAGAFDDLATGRSDSAGEWDASLVVNAEYVASNGLVWGLRAEVDTGDREVEDLQRDEIYAYLAGGFGRIELGEQDGAADTIALHAPIIGLGQVRGDFVRYTGAPALLTPFDTRDALKIVYLSPPWNGVRFGVSYAPEVESNSKDANPRRRTQQENGVEVGIAYQTPIAANWALGVSGAYVSAQADPITQRADIESWSIGGELGRDKLSVGGAFVSRGNSNSLTAGLDEKEWNLGVAWRDDKWGLAASTALTTSSTLDNRLIGLGGYYELSRWWVVRADLVSAREERPGAANREGLIGLAEISFRF